jgi:hypothetical protein
VVVGKVQVAEAMAAAVQVVVEKEEAEAVAAGPAVVETVLVRRVGAAGAVGVDVERWKGRLAVAKATVRWAEATLAVAGLAAAEKAVVVVVVVG